MNKKTPIILVIGLVIISTICIAKAKASETKSFDINISQKNSKNIVDSINLEDGKNYNNKFDNTNIVENMFLKKQSLVLENNDIKIQVDAQGKPDYYLNKVITSTGKTNSNAIKKQNDFLSQKAQKMADNFEKQEKTLILEEDETNSFKTYKWARTYKGYKYDFDFIIVSLDPSTGEIGGASKQFISNNPSINIKVKDNEAKKIASNFLSGFSDLKVGDIKTEETVIVNPNYRWTNKAVKEFNTNTRLAYAYTFNVTKPYDGELIIWIDVEDGSVLGGTVSK